MWEEEFIKKYNALITRLSKADKYITDFPGSVDNPKILNEYHSIIKQLSNMITEYKNHTGIEMNLKEKLNGFVVDNI